MSTNVSIEPVVRFTITWEKGRLMDVSTNYASIDHFLDLVKMSRAYNTWVNYAHDLKVFFQTIPKSPQAITRSDCLAFMKQRDEAGLSDATINRRLAAVSSLFSELQLLEPTSFVQNPVCPRPTRRESRQRRQGLYRKQAQRVPSILSEDELKTFLGSLPSWRDRTLVLLMWISCLRVSEVVAIRFQDIECSHRSICIPNAKGNLTRTVFMNPLTFATLNFYLDEERKDLFPNEDHIFVAFKGRARGNPLSVNAVQKMVYYYAEKCGFPHLHAHLFRHTGITHLVQSRIGLPMWRCMTSGACQMVCVVIL